MKKSKSNRINNKEICRKRIKLSNGHMKLYFRAKRSLMQCKNYSHLTFTLTFKYKLISWKLRASERIKKKKNPISVINGRNSTTHINITKIQSVTYLVLPSSLKRTLSLTINYNKRKQKCTYAVIYINLITNSSECTKYLKPITWSFFISFFRSASYFSFWFALVAL